MPFGGALALLRLLLQADCCQAELIVLHRSGFKLQPRRGEQRDMNQNLPPPCEGQQPMGVAIAHKQKQLKRNHSTRPNRCIPAKLRESDFGDQGLDEEQQEAGEQGKGSEGCERCLRTSFRYEFA